VAISAPVNALTLKVETRKRAAGALLVAVFAAATGCEAVIKAQDESSCAQIAAPADRLACYDRALPPTQPPPATIGDRDAIEKSSVVPVTSPSAVVATTETESEQDDAVSIVVVGMRKYPGRSATFTTDKGDVWVQIGGEGLYLPKVPFDAELKPASMGTYFLRPSEYGWRVHVRRDD
jgi:hypothetical protein